MEQVNVANGVVHLHRNLFPCFEAEVSEFQQRLAFRVRHCLYDGDHFLLQIHQSLDVVIDLRLQGDDLC